jgi:ribosome biogenesis GTPase A
MAKAKREINEKRKIIDVIVEVVDARMPLESRNPDIKEIIQNKKHIILLNKMDLADPVVNDQWIKYFRKYENSQALLINANQSKHIQNVIEIVKSYKKTNKRDVKCLICGIPNVGKSTIINSLAKKSSAKTGNKPGVTKGQQWIKTKDNLTILDTPGLLWPKFEDQQVGLHLAWIGTIKDTIIDIENCSFELLVFLIENYPDLLEKRYGIQLNNMEYHEVFEEIARKRGYILKNSNFDYMRTSEMLMNEFKNGKIGRISIERPPNGVK